MWPRGMHQCSSALSGGKGGTCMPKLFPPHPTPKPPNPLSCTLDWRVDVDDVSERVLGGECARTCGRSVRQLGRARGAGWDGGEGREGGEGGGAQVAGSLKVGESALEWRSSGTDKRVALKGAEVESATWYPQGPFAQVWVQQRAGPLHKLDGFRGKDFDQVASALSAAGVRGGLRKGELATSGGNWVRASVDGSALFLRDDAGKPLSVLPLDAVAQCALPGASKTELEVQLAEDDTVARTDECLIEMRLAYPGGGDDDAGGDDAGASAAAAAASSSSAAASGAGGGGVGTAEALHNAIASKTKLGAAGAPLVEFSDLNFLTPRGRYSVELYGAFMHLAGAQYEYKIAYRSVARMFYLEVPPAQGMKEVTRVLLVISLDDPVRQGERRFPHLVLNIENVDFSLDHTGIPAEERSKLGLADKTEGLMPKVVATVLRALTNKHLLTTGSFRSAKDNMAVKCSVQTSEGYLYPLERSFFFVHKPATYIRYNDIAQIEFSRVGAGASKVRSSTFDMSVKCKKIDGAAEQRRYNFVGIDREELPKLLAYLKDKCNLPCTTDQDLDTNELVRRQIAEEGGDDEDDGDDGDDEDAAEAGKGARRAAGAAGGGGGAGGAMDDDDDDEEDESFGTDDESDESDDDDDEDEEEEEDEGAAGKKRARPKGAAKPKAPKQARKDEEEAGDDDDDDDDDEEE
jgi:structure-specific recognition protein 1